MILYSIDTIRMEELLNNTISNTSSSYLNKMDTNFVNMMIMPFFMSTISGLTTSITELIKFISKILWSIILKILRKVIEYIPYCKKYTINISYDKYDISMNENNKVLIDAILYNYQHGTFYKMTNKGVPNSEYTELAREKNREMVLSILDEFKEDGINVFYQKKEKQMASPDPDKSSTQSYDVEHITLDSYKSIEHIKTYIETKRNIYINKFCSTDEKPYVYNGNQYGGNDVVFQKIIFDTNKTFKSWFYSEKPKILDMIYNFTHKKGSYMLTSNVYKLGILLHGKPGCGKTSFIKALAKEMNRSIITISLDKFSNCASFTKLFHSQYIMAPSIQDNRYCWDYVPMNKRILVFEDIDTAGDIVKKREDVIEFIEEENDDNENDETKKEVKKTEVKKSETKKDKNELVLGDILNALDGICETTGLVYIMTTNHVETLDPALIRAGRITCSIELKEMNTQELNEILNYYYVDNNIYENDGMSHDDKKSLIEEMSKLLDGKCTPSVIENYCNKYDLDGFHDNIDKLLG
jgi:hypothetical protein